MFFVNLEIYGVFVKHGYLQDDSNPVFTASTYFFINCFVEVLLFIILGLSSLFDKNLLI